MQMQIARHVAGEVFNAALTIASERDPDLRITELKGAFPQIKEDTWQEVDHQPHQGIALNMHLVQMQSAQPSRYVRLCRSP